MGEWNRNRDSTNPCNGCEERKVGCHGACGRYKEWRRKLDEKNERRVEFLKRGGTMSEAAEREIWRKQRWSRQQPIRRSGKER